jgi:hypothetical protein
MKHFPAINEARLKNYEAIRVAATIFVETLEKHLPHEELYQSEEDGGNTRYVYGSLIENIEELMNKALNVDHCSSGTCDA